MAIEAYVPLFVQVGDHLIDRAILLTLYEPDGDNPSGSVTTERPLPEGAGGTLRLEATRGGESWLVAADQISVVNSSAVGFEFAMSSRPTREIISESSPET